LIAKGSWPKVMGELLKEAKAGTAEKIREMLNEWNEKMLEKTGS